MQAINVDPLNETKRINWKTAVKNPYIDKISNEEKIEMVLDLLYEDCKMPKDDFKVLIDKTLVRLV
ncbi:MAG: hypothetical protein IKI71_05085 [Lachnospiraceae bacterium]|nr:hypothetical protein [Lachnospiraceae bacterium]